MEVFPFINFENIFHLVLKVSFDHFEHINVSFVPFDERIIFLKNLWNSCSEPANKILAKF